ncbi:HEAT repeat domain-containing protein [Haliovirga abyssi]|uniref:HEAT repeat domain-containing protein n=1 Tax=Haliovirga abyssi TaxID=2996794 RepID=A0AAU9DMU5_9FUSO|nr:hypothetical protein [Haliovirga abyssi]BDU49633.1 hypothetical protein HLVA_02020 [Haliovirga abyssi]
MKELLEKLENGKTEEKLDIIEEIFEKRNFENYLVEIVDYLEKSKEGIVREKIVNYLKKYNNPKIVDKLLKFYESNDIFLRNVAVDIISQFYELPFANLTKMLNHENKHVRKLALDTLYNTHNPMVAGFISTALYDDEDINNVITAVEYLGKLKAYKYADDIAELLKDAEAPFLIITILGTLSLIGNKYSYMKVKDIYPDIEKVDALFLAPLLKFYKKFNGGELIEEILKLKSKYSLLYKEVIDIVKDFIDNGKPEEIDEKGEDIYNLLKELLEEKIPEANKYEVIHILALFEGEEVEYILVESLHNGSDILKIGATEELLKIDFNKYKDEIKKVIEDEKDENTKENLIILLEGDNNEA